MVQTISTSRGGISRPPDRHVRFLVILLDENLSFKHHCALVKLKLSRNLGVLRKLRHCFPGSIIKILFHSLIQPYMYYCSTVWLSTFSSFTFPVFKIYNRAIKLVSEVTDQLSMNLLDGQSTYIFLSSCFIFKYFHGLLPNFFKQLYLLNSELRIESCVSFSLRNDMDIFIHKTKTIRSDFNPVLCCASIWNSLPVKIRLCHSYGQFKKQLTNHLLCLDS